MKYILSLVLLVGIAVSSKAQVDSSQYYLPFQIKQKYAKIMVPDVIRLEDARFIDSLNKAIGSGLDAQADSVSVVSFKIGTYMKGVEKIADLQVGGAYVFGPEFINAPLVANGYSGLFAALNYYAQFGTANQKIAAIWGLARLNDLIARKKAVLDEAIRLGGERAKAVKTIIYN